MAIKYRRNVVMREGTAAELAADATVYPQNVLLFATDTGVLKIGNGVDTYSTLSGPNQAAAQVDSVATTVAGVVTDFNALLAKLRAAGLMA